VSECQRRRAACNERRAVMSSFMLRNTVSLRTRRSSQDHVFRTASCDPDPKVQIEISEHRHQYVLKIRWDKRYDKPFLAGPFREGWQKKEVREGVNALQ